MPWIILLASAVCEAVWATALGASHGLTEFVPVIVFVLGLIASTVGLAFAMRHIPIGTAYAAWTSLGAALTVSYAMTTGSESVSLAKIVFLIGIIGCVVGLKLTSAENHRKSPHK